MTQSGSTLTKNVTTQGAAPFDTPFVALKATQDAAQATNRILSSAYRRVRLSSYNF